jgi:hypothetical protein
VSPRAPIARVALLGLLGVLSLLGSAGCEATFTPMPAYAVVPATDVPVDVWGYPRVYYGDSYVYLVNGLWYRPTPRGWVVFRTEPVELSRQRTRIYATPRRPSPAVRAPVYGYPRPAPLREPTEYERRRAPNPP